MGEGGRGEAGGRGGARWLAVAEEEFVPTDSGGRVESLNLLRSAAGAGVRLHVVVPGMTTADSGAAHRAALPEATVVGVPRRTGAVSHLSLAPYVFASRPMGRALLHELRTHHRDDPFDAVVSVSFRVAHMGEAVAAALDLPLLVRPHNIESDYFAQLARSVRAPMKLPYLVEAAKLRRAEARIHASSHVTLFADIALADAERRRRLTAIPVVHVPPFLAARVGAPVPAPATGPTVLFVGSLDNGNNADGITWFARHCWPLLRTALGPSTLHVVGRRASDRLRAELERLGALVTADAPDVAPFLAEAGVVVNPVRSGAGVNIKMVEAMAAGRAVVSTTVGARGLHWRAGEHFDVADTAEEFAAAVRGLLADPARRTRLAAAGRAFVERELDGVAQIRSLVATMAAAAPGRPAGRA